MGGSQRTNIEGGLLNKGGGGRGGAWTVHKFKEGGGLDKKEGVGVFGVGLIPQCTL